ncbi:MAG: stage II sporulation protein R [Clostridia bacterium]|nr:stage II sporulation protein R [Clostridia bacterium]
MRTIVTVLISAIVFFALNSIIPTKEECEIYNSTIRLHVVANSDSEKDQAVKLEVRDAILEKMSEIKAQSKEEALLTVKGEKDELEEIAEQVLKSNGITDEVKIEIGEESYPTRYYDDFALPAGTYTSVRVLIGEGDGQNWWCVLYPPLCTSQAIESEEDSIAVGLTKDQYSLITGKTKEYKIKFKILEMAKEAFGLLND